ncbi:MAG: site-specific integrase [Halobacteriota archaeon]|nr:site-specific integrase [Halobacteriota archaeon]
MPYSEDAVKRVLSIFSEEEVEIDSSLYFESLKKELTSRKYSPKTIKSYIHYNEDFLRFIEKNPDKITNSDMKDYLSYLVNKREVSTSTLNIAINALKFYYGEVLNQRFIYEIKRPKKDKKLPVILSMDEISEILSAVLNVKNKAILLLVNSSGSRAG